MDDSPNRLFSWLTPVRCRGIFAALVVVGFLGHLRYLTHRCPIDLSGDEAQYWDWSRQLGWSYYSKGPLVAWIIRASCALFGRDSMLAVRFPALLLAAGSSALTYLLSLRLFGSDRLALGTVLLTFLVPMFIAGSLLMTIDPPFYFCWALATWLAAGALLDGGRSGRLILAGAVVGVGFLAKYAMLLWFAPLLVAMAIDPPSRGQLRRPALWTGMGLALLFTAPVLAWNARHGWASLHHVATQTGADADGRFSPGNLLGFVAGQLGIILPPLALLMLAGVLYAIGPGAGGRRWVPAEPSPFEPRRREMRFLACFGVCPLAWTLLAGLRTKPQLNWAAPAYFTLTILAGYFIASRLGLPSWRRWRWALWATIALGLALVPIVHDPRLLYPAARWLNAASAPARAARADPRLPPASASATLLARLLPTRGLEGRNIDFTAKLQGWRELGQRVTDERRRLGPGAFVLCSDYQETAEMAFYVEGQPKTYYLGSYFRRSPKRLTQYDFWPDRRLDPRAGPGGRNPLLGRNAIFVGQFDKAPPELVEAFDHVFTPSPGSIANRRAMQLAIDRGGLEVQSFRLIRCYGFKGLSRPRSMPAF